MKRSYIKIYGPPVLKAIRALEKVAIEMPEVCIMDSLIQVLLGVTSAGKPVRTDLILNYFGTIVRIPNQQRFEKIICKSGAKLGDYDFYFEWLKKPTLEDIHSLVERIDEELKNLGCEYTITTK